MEYGSELLLNKLYSQDKEYLPFVLMLSHLGNATINCWMYTVQCSNFQWRNHQQWLPQVTYSPSPSTNSEGLGAVLILWTTTGEQSGSVHTRYMYSVHKHRDCRPMYTHNKNNVIVCSIKPLPTMILYTQKLIRGSYSKGNVNINVWHVTTITSICMMMVLHWLVMPPHMLKPPLDSHHPQTVESELIPQ